jgi:hypothetical protein
MLALTLILGMLVFEYIGYLAGPAMVRSGCSIVTLGRATWNDCPRWPTGSRQGVNTEDLRHFGSVV